MPPRGPLPTVLPAMSLIEAMPLDCSAITWKGVWYIGNVARTSFISTPGAIGLLPSQASRAGPSVVIAIWMSPAWVSAKFCTGPPVTSELVGTSSISWIIPAQPAP